MTAPNRPRVLVADDDASFRTAMRKALGRFGFPVEEAPTGEEAVVAIASGRPDVVLLDLQLGDMSGLDVLRRTQGARSRIVVVTGQGTIPAAVEAMRLGATSVVQKPVDAPAILPLLEDAAREVDSVPPSLRVGDDLGLVGPSPKLAAVRALVRRAGPTLETVLVMGESGVGKELVARALHAESPRAKGPFVAFNCAQAQSELFDAELFGHAKGSFTGATRDRTGLFREADGGTLFLDEIGELSERAQSKLLRALETSTVRPVGSDREESIDVRVVAATNRDLAQAVEKGTFRKDLFFRLHVLCIGIPALRDRKEDVVPIAAALIARLGAQRDRRLELATDAVPALLAYDWPGNVRELANVLKRAALFCDHDRVDGACVREAIGSSIFGHPSARAGRTTATEGETLADVERRHILSTFERLGGNVTKTAQALEVDRRTLQRKLRSYGRDVEDD